jgi:hypothetical protein
VRELRRLGGLLKHNFETLRQAKMSPDFIGLHEDVLRTLGEKIVAIGKAQNDCEKDQER